MKIKAAVTRSKGSAFELMDLYLDEPRDDEILIQVKAVGLCHTDLIARDQLLPVPLPAVFGHEGAGIVVKTGASVTKVAPGDRVVMTIRSCGHCTRCAAGEPTYCETSTGLNYSGCRPDGSTSLSLDGQPISSNFFGQSSFANYAIAYETNVVRVDDELPFERLAPLGCGVQTGAGSILRALRCTAGSSVVIAGGGSVGLSAVLGAKVAGCATIIVSDPMPARRELALQIGATHAHDPASGDLRAFVRAAVPAGSDYAVDTTGLRSVMEATLACLRPHGTLGLLGAPQERKQPVPGLASVVLTYGYTIKGIIEGDSDPDVFIPELIRLHREGRFDFDRLVSVYPFEQINQAVADQHSGKVVKAVLSLAS